MRWWKIIVRFAYIVFPMKRTLVIAAFVACGYTGYAQEKKIEVRPNSLSKPVPPSNTFWRTIYYNADWKVLPNKKEAVYYREPVIKNGDRYEVEFFRADGTRVKTCSYLPTIVNYQLNIDEGVGIKDGPFVYYDAKGEKQTEGSYIQDKKEGPWKEYVNGKLSSTVVYKDNVIVSETVPAPATSE